jgi:2,3-bisphosphoglycerate-independent phosphoglycerate mutase
MKPPSQTLGEVVENANISQLRIAETEKYAHVTFFFNGGREAKFSKEERILIPSPKVATYDLKAEMSAHKLTDRLIKAIGSGKFGLIVVNYANGDMVGHTGVLDAAIEAVNTIDNCLAKVESAVIQSGNAMLVTADHGNCELMVDPITKEPHTAHTTGPVPIVLVGVPENTNLNNGCLADIAPTIITLMKLEKPKEMSGNSLIRL